MNISKVDKILLWAWTLAFASALLIRVLDHRDLAFPGMSYLMDQPLLVVVGQALILLCASIFLSIESWLTKKRIRILCVSSASLIILGFAYLGIPFGLACAAVFSICYRVLKALSNDALKPVQKKSFHR